jgi:hypothetical protein
MHHTKAILHWLLTKHTCLLSAAGRAEGVTDPLPAAPGCWNRTDRATAVFAIAKDEAGAAAPADGADEDDDDDEADEEDDDDDAESGEEVGEDGDEEGAEEDAPIVAQPNAKLQALWQCTIITAKKGKISKLDATTLPPTYRVSINYPCTVSIENIFYQLILFSILHLNLFIPCELQVQVFYSTYTVISLLSNSCEPLYFTV